MSEQTGRSEAIRKLREQIEGIQIAMMTTAQPDGTLRSRPMATQRAEFDGDLWFFTRVDSPKVDELERDHHVNVSYAAPHDNRYVSVSGTARLVRDRRKAEELWNPFYKAWFPDGLDDPHLALLKVEVQQAEYWDMPSSRMVLLAGWVKATVTGQEFHPGDNQKLDLEEPEASETAGARP